MLSLTLLDNYQVSIFSLKQSFWRFESPFSRGQVLVIRICFHRKVSPREDLDIRISDLSATGGFTFAMLLCGPLAAAPVSALNCQDLTLHLCCSDTTLSYRTIWPCPNPFYLTPTLLFFSEKTSDCPYKHSLTAFCYLFCYLYCHRIVHRIVLF